MPFVHENVKVELFPGTPSPIVYLSENDVGDTVVFELVYKGQPVNIPSGSVVKFKGTKKDGLGFTVDSSNISGNNVSFIVSEDMTSCSGVVEAEISITLSNNKHGTCNVVLIVEKNPHSDGTQDGSYPQIVSEMRQLVEQIEGDAETASSAANIAVAAKNSALEIQQDVHQYTADAIDDWLNDHPEATTTVQDGAITEAKLANALKLKAINDYVTPQMYGATGDGVADDTSAFVDACNSGFPVYVKDCAIGSCEVHDVKICANNMVLKGRIKGHNIDFTGSIDVDGGHFFVDRSTSALAGRDNSIFHEINVHVLSGAYLFDLYGTLYNVKFSNINISGKFTENVIKLRTSTWLTYTSINNCFFGSCDNPIYIDDQSSTHNQIGDIYITNSYAQKYNASGVCHFVSTNSKGLLVLDGSFMYDIDANSGDSEIYIRRNGTDVAPFKIVCKNKDLSTIGLISDSNGKRGLELSFDIGYEPTDANGNGILPSKVTLNPNFYSISSFGWGNALFSYVSSHNVIGTLFKVGHAISATFRQALLGVSGQDGKLSVVYTASSDAVSVLRTYDSNTDARIVSTKAQIDAYGQGVALFYTPLKKAVFRWDSTYYDAMGNNITSDIT